MGIMGANRVFNQVTAVTEPVLAMDSSRLPAALYHYTTPAGLLGIIESNGIYLTDARFLNDSSEITYGRSLFLERLNHFVERNGSPYGRQLLDQVQRELGRDRDGLGWIPFTSHVASFCTNGNLLSQWRAYARASSGGYSIGFASSKLLESARVDWVGATAGTTYPISLRQVVYEPAQQHELLDNVITRIFELLPPTGRFSDYEWGYVADAIAGGVIPAVVPLIKSPVFREEQEWRLVCRVGSGVRFRIANGIVPYVFCRVGTPDAAPPMPVSDIYVGPSVDVGLNKTGVRALLRAHHLHEVPLIDSEIPLRVL